MALMRAPETLAAAGAWLQLRGGDLLPDALRPDGFAGGWLQLGDPPTAFLLVDTGLRVLAIDPVDPDDVDWGGA